MTTTWKGDCGCSFDVAWIGSPTNDHVVQSARVCPNHAAVSASTPLRSTAAHEEHRRRDRLLTEIAARVASASQVEPDGSRAVLLEAIRLTWSGTGTRTLGLQILSALTTTQKNQLRTALTAAFSATVVLG